MGGARKAEVDSAVLERGFEFELFFAAPVQVFSRAGIREKENRGLNWPLDLGLGIKKRLFYVQAPA